MLQRDATVIAHTLTRTSKMPCKSYSLPAAACKTGSALAKVVGSICNNCYANKGRYVMNGHEARQKRLDSITHPQWVEALTVLVSKSQFFRWHDSGDIQSLEHLTKIVEVCKRTPKTKHWLPTRERKLVEQWMKQNGSLPKNLVVRMSAVFFDASVKPIKGISTTSGSHKHKPALGFECIAPQQNNSCGICRVCWDKRVKHVSYKAH